MSNKRFAKIFSPSFRATFYLHFVYHSSGPAPKKLLPAPKKLVSNFLAEPPESVTFSLEKIHSPRKMLSCLEFVPASSLDPRPTGSGEENLGREERERARAR